MTAFLLHSTMRSLISQTLFSFLTSSIFPYAMRRRAVAAIVALAAAAGLDGASARGWEYEYVFGHPFLYYLLANVPGTFAVLIFFLLVLGRPANTEG